MSYKVSTVLAVFFLATCLGSAQKIVKKTLVNPESRVFQIDASNCFEVQLGTSNTEEIVISATIDGEYQKDLLIGVEEDGSNVLISAGFQPNFVNPNDKLSAHKVVSVAMDISLPEYTQVTLFGTNANISVTGLYKHLIVSLADGNCILANVSETIEVKTQKGNIFLTAREGKIDAKSNYGDVESEAIPSGDSYYRLHSVEGDIQVKRTE